MRRLATIMLVALVPLSVAAGGAPPGWSELVGKTCIIRNSKGAVEAKFGDGNDGPYVELRQQVTKTKKVTFTPVGGMTFETYLGGATSEFQYNDKDRTWSGSVSGDPRTLICQS